MSSYTVTVKVPEVGESVTEATVGEWLKEDGEWVEQDEAIVILETDKASVDVVAESSGLLQIKAQEGETLAVGKPLAYLVEDESNAKVSRSKKKSKIKASKPTEPAESAKLAKPAKPVRPTEPVKFTKPEKAEEPKKTEKSKGIPKKTREDLSSIRPGLRSAVLQGKEKTGSSPDFSQGNSIAINTTSTSLVTHTKSTSSRMPALERTPSPLPARESSERRRMSSLRLRIAERLVQAQQNAAILSTFNEMDMTQILRLRKQYKEMYEERYGVRLGFMGFFIKATIEALKAYPAINAFIDGEDMIYHHFYHIGVAVGTPRGLVVPVVRHADQLSLAEIERSIHTFAMKAQEGKLSVDDMQNGTFTISNGGVYGSLLSTPILNPPQSGILGMHKIEQRPVAVNNEVVIRPMMYVALSYDHRIVDGREAVSFLVRIKECIEDPERLLLQI